MATCGQIFQFESVGHSSLFISSYYIQMTKILSHVPLLCRIIFYHSYHIQVQYTSSTANQHMLWLLPYLSSYQQSLSMGSDCSEPHVRSIVPLWFCAACDIVVLPPGQSNDGDDHDFLSCDWGKLWSFLVLMSLLILVSGEAALRCLSVAC